MHRLSQTYISTEKWERQMTCESDLDQIYPLILSNESCARAGEGVTFPQIRKCKQNFKNCLEIMLLISD